MPVSYDVLDMRRYGTLSSMARMNQGSIFLGRVAGVDLFLHWSWFVVAFYEIGRGSARYRSIVWNVLEYLALFAIVLLHEFGHSLACRQVGGTADRIMLWPLGGVAFVDPPQRPGATLWSIAAGPLVNVALLPVLIAAVWLSASLGWAETTPDAYRLLRAVLYIDAGLLIFNILPIYPLDGGQILRSLLWFVLGQAKSLVAATALGFIGAAGFVCIALWARSGWTLLIAGYMLLSCWGGLKSALALIRYEKRPKRAGIACPNCGAVPPVGPFWRCTDCGALFDTFETQATCPQCGSQHANTMCGQCRQLTLMTTWYTGSLSSVGAGDSALAGDPK